MQTCLSLSPETRRRIREELGIPRSGYVEVLDGRVLCDGTMLEDLQKLTTLKMQEFLGSIETDFHKLFTSVVERIENPQKQVESELEITILPASEVKKEKRKYERRKKSK